MVWLRIKRTLRALPKWQLAVLAMFFGWLFLTLFGPYLAPFPTEVAEPTTPPAAAQPVRTRSAPTRTGIDIFSACAAPRTDVVIGVVATAISVLLGRAARRHRRPLREPGGAGSDRVRRDLHARAGGDPVLPVFVLRDGAGRGLRRQRHQHHHRHRLREHAGLPCASCAPTCSRWCSALRRGRACRRQPRGAHRLPPRAAQRAADRHRAGLGHGGLRHPAHPRA